MPVDLKAISKWSEEKLLARVKVIGEHLKKVPTDVSRIDELIIIFLEILKIAMRDKKLEGSALDLFPGVYGSMTHPAATKIFERFFETRWMAECFKTGNKVEKGRFRPQLVARGML